MAEHKGFILYKDNRSLVDLCTDEQAGKLIKGLYAFACDGEELQTDDLMLRGFYAVFRNTIIRDDQKYQARCRVNSENGARGGRPKKQSQPNGYEDNQSQRNGYEGKRLKPKKADIEKGNDIVMENDKVMGIDGGSGGEKERDVGEPIGEPLTNNEQQSWDEYKMMEAFKSRQNDYNRGKNNVRSMESSCC